MTDTHQCTNFRNDRLDHESVSNICGVCLELYLHVSFLSDHQMPGNYTGLYSKHVMETWCLEAAVNHNSSAILDIVTKRTKQTLKMVIVDEGLGGTDC